MAESTPPSNGQPGLTAEDGKLVTLARSARARTGAAEGAAVRDTDGRTYAAATVALDSLRLTALQAAVAAAVSSGAASLAAAAVVSGSSSQPPLEAESVQAQSLRALRDLGPAAPVYLADGSGQLAQVIQ